MKCVTCKEEKSVDYFYFRTDTKKYRAQCISCHKGYRKSRSDRTNKVIDGKKRCGKCLEIFPVSMFHKDKHNPAVLLTSWCKVCKKKYQTENAMQIAITRICSRYNVSRDEAKILFNANTCAICFESISGMKKAIDHCHTSGKVRGVLCAPCNQGLGSFRDSTERLKSAIAYLDKQT
jgi:hypothetical protein